MDIHQFKVNIANKFCWAELAKLISYFKRCKVVRYVMFKDDEVVSVNMYMNILGFEIFF